MQILPITLASRMGMKSFTKQRTVVKSDVKNHTFSAASCLCLIFTFDGLLCWECLFLFVSVCFELLTLSDVVFVILLEFRY